MYYEAASEYYFDSKYFAKKNAFPFEKIKTYRNTLGIISQ
jgi:hypothetical protein